MPWGQIGAVLAVLVVVYAVGHIWFHIVEGVLGALKRLFSGKKAPGAWHTLPDEKEEDGDA